MGGKTVESVNVTEAKAHLRRVAGELGVVPWVRRQPLDAVFVAVAAGFLAGRLPRLLRSLGLARIGEQVIKRMV